MKRRKLGRDVAVVGAGMSPFGMFKDKDSKDLFAEAFREMIVSVDKGVDPGEIDALYLGNFSNDYFVHQSHWGPIISDLVGVAPKAATRTEGACASSALAFREGVFAIASGFYDMVLVGGVEEMSKRTTEEVAEGLAHEIVIAEISQIQRLDLPWINTFFHRSDHFPESIREKILGIFIPEHAEFGHSGPDNRHVSGKFSSFFHFFLQF